MRYRWLVTLSLGLIVVGLVALGSGLLIRWIRTVGAAGPAGTANATGEVQPTSGVMPVPVLDLIRFSQRPLDISGTVTPEYVAEGLRHLAGALDILDVGYEELPNDLRIAAGHVLLNPTSAGTAGLVRDLTHSTAVALAARSEAAAPLATDAALISASSPITNQGPIVREFFSNAAEAIARISADTA